LVIVVVVECTCGSHDSIFFMLSDGNWHLVLFLIGSTPIMHLFHTHTCQSLLPALIIMACFQMHPMESIYLSYAVANHFRPLFRLQCNAHDKFHYAFHMGVFHMASSVTLQTVNGKRRLATPAQHPSTGTALASAILWRG
jgi:hypothetical protein